jgi:predicted nucleic-acid-binding protein
MNGVDTNVLVRLLTRDDPVQYRQAYELFEHGAQIFLAPTVLLETEWVLRYAYDFSAEQINGALRALCGLPSVTVGSALAVEKALLWHEQGLDFADALHLASGGGDLFHTFDRRLAATAARVGATLVQAL